MKEYLKVLYYNLFLIINKMDFLMAMEDIYILMEVIIMERLNQEWKMVLEYFYKKIILNIKENGSKINLMVKEKKNDLI